MTAIVSSRKTDLFDVKFSEKMDKFHQRTLNFEWPNEKMRHEITDSDLEDLRLAGVEYDGHWGFNWILSNKMKSNQVSEEKSEMTVHMIPSKEIVRRVEIDYIDCLDHK